MKKGTILGVTALLALTVSPSLAQEHPHGGDGGHGSMNGSSQMMQGMHAPTMHTQPAMLLHAVDALALTSEQVEKLTALKDRTQPEHHRHMQAAMDAHQMAASALGGDAPDVGKYEESLRTAADHMIAAHVITARAAVEARNLLTEEQLARVDEVMSEMHEMHEMHGGMEHGGSGSGHPGHD